jgi:hypothetical protein
MIFDFDSAETFTNFVYESVQDSFKESSSDSI